jgi:hypothetical protein
MQIFSHEVLFGTVLVLLYIEYSLCYSAIIRIFLLNCYNCKLLPISIMLFEPIVFHFIIVLLLFDHSYYSATGNDSRYFDPKKPWRSNHHLQPRDNKHHALQDLPTYILASIGCRKGLIPTIDVSWEIRNQFLLLKSRRAGQSLCTIKAEILKHF